MDIYEVRRINLIKLMGKYKTQKELAKLIDRPASYLSQLKKGFNNKGERVSMCNAFARHLEKELNLPNGIMDMLNSDDVIIPKKHLIPIKTTALIAKTGTWEDINPSENQKKEEYLEDYSSEPNNYIIRFIGDGLHPAIRSGWCAVFNENKPISSGEYVHVKLKDGQNMIKEFVSNQSGVLTLMSITNSDRLSLRNDEVESITAFVGLQPPSCLRRDDE